MAELKTQRTDASAVEFINSVEPEERRNDGLALLRMFQKVTGEKPVMWGASIVGYGMYHYKSERSAQEGDWPLVAFSPRKQNLTLYIMTGNADNTELLAKLGPHKASVGCLYLKRLSDVDQDVLEQLIKHCYDYMKKTNS